MNCPQGLAIFSKARRSIEIVYKGEKGDWYQLEMLFGKWYANDCDRQENGACQVRKCDFPAEQHDPDDGEDKLQTASIRPFFDHFLAEWGHVSQAQLDRSQAKWYSDDCQAKKQPAQYIAKPGQKAPKYQPDDIAK